MLQGEAGEKIWHRVALLWCLLALCLYLPALEFGLFADDEIYLAFKNRIIRELPASELYQLLWTPANPWEFLPIRDFTYWLDLRLFGDDGLGLHATNLFLYALSGLLTSLFLREVLLLNAERLSRSGAATAAICGTALFMLHPAHVEAVVWIAARKDLLAGVFSLAALIVLLRGLRVGAKIPHMAVSALLFLLACFSKSAAVAIVLPASAIILRVSLASESRRVRIALGIGLLLYVLVSIAASAIHLHFGWVNNIRIENAPGFPAVLERASRILSSLLRMAFFPADLGLLHQVRELGDWHWLVSLFAALAFFWAWFACLVSRRWEVALAVVMLIAPMLPYLQFAPFSTWSMASERFIYLSISGISLFAAYGLSRSKYAASTLAAICVVFSLLGFSVWSRVQDWEHPSILMTKEYERAPSHYVAVLNYVSYVLVPGSEDRVHSVVDGIADNDAREMADLYFNLLFMDMHARETAGLNALKTAAPTEDFCKGVVRIYQLHKHGTERLRHDPDVVFSNFLRSIERQMYFILGNPLKRCDA